MTPIYLRRVSALLVALSVSACGPDSPVETLPAGPALQVGPSGAQFEVWLVDQSSSAGLTYGGTLYVYDGSDLMGEAAASASPTDVIDLAGAAAALCLGSTGTNPVRPHMLFFNSTHTRAVLAFVASGHVVIFDAATRAPVQCIDVGLQAHAAIPAPDDSYILVANQNGKLLQRINADFATNTFTLDAAATLDLATCVTPNGTACQDVLLRPDNAPICPIIAPGSDLAFVTLRGGGLFVVNARTSPMAIRGEYDQAAVHPNGCGGIAANGWMFINSGGGTAGNLNEFDLYRFQVSAFSPNAANAPNTPAPTVLFSDDVDPRDSHGAALTKLQRYLWVGDRGSNVAEVFDVSSGARVNTVVLSGTGADDPTPDLIDLAPSGNRLFFSLRGPNPLTGDPHVATGSTPGLGVYQVEADGADARLKAVVRISNLDAGGIERADAHAVRVRRK
ncbi:MAG TPA: hypothetical protein VGA42_02180 [Gemmatimonadales bacterium]